MKKLSIFVVLFSLLVSGCATTQVNRQKVPEIVWPKPPEKPRIKLLAVYTGSRDIIPESSIERFLGEIRDFRLIRPHGVVADSEGNIFVTDTRFLRIIKFDFKNKKFIVTRGKGQMKVVLPLGLALDEQRRLLFVADGEQDVVIVYDMDTLESKFVIGESAKPKLKRPVSVAVDPLRQRIYVTDTRLQDVFAFDYSGRQIWKLGKDKRSAADDGFNTPASVAIDSKGNVYVIDTFNRYVKVFTPDGRFIKKLGYGVGMTPGHFSKPYGVALDSDDHIYVLDTDFCNFQIFDFDNNLLLFVGSPGTKYGKFFIPTSIYINKKTDKIYITDTWNARIVVLQYIKYPEEKSSQGS